MSIQVEKAYKNGKEISTVGDIEIKTSVYVKRYDGQTTWMYFLTEND